MSNNDSLLKSRGLTRGLSDGAVVHLMDGTFGETEPLPPITNPGTLLAHCTGCDWMPNVDGHAADCPHGEVR